MIDDSRLEEVVGRYAELTERLSDQALYDDPKAYKEVSVERAGLEELAEKAKEFLESKARLAQNKADLRAESDASMADLYKEEISDLEESLERLTE
ncbi:MAG: PCRF domain-containing protein, partial [Candidatus Eremiobacteraeota bacterium]|nr:PCRF domain-containing protein [Candidatus Eremiobacteraeota bacterium]